MPLPHGTPLQCGGGGGDTTFRPRVTPSDWPQGLTPERSGRICSGFESWRALSDTLNSKPQLKTSEPAEPWAGPGRLFSEGVAGRRTGPLGRDSFVPQGLLCSPGTSRSRGSSQLYLTVKGPSLSAGLWLQFKVMQISREHLQQVHKHRCPHPSQASSPTACALGFVLHLGCRLHEPCYQVQHLGRHVFKQNSPVSLTT